MPLSLPARSLRLGSVLFFALSSAPLQCQQFERDLYDGLQLGIRIVGAADFDGDGDADLVGHDEGAPASTYLLVRDGVGRYVRSEAPLVPRIVEWIVPVDLDGDGDLDCIAGGSTTRGIGPFVVLRNDGGGTLREDRRALPGGIDRFVAEPVLIDLDGDGDLDLFAGRYFASPSSPQALQLLNDGAGRFTAAPAASTFVQYPMAGGALTEHAIFDLDGDGAEDILFGAGRVMLMNRGGTLVNESLQRLFGPSRSAGTPVLLDFDGDGDLDVAMLGEPPVFGVRIWRNTGGQLVAAFVLATATDRGRLIGGDWDRDGDVDLIAAAPWLTSGLNGGFSTYLESNGAGGFADRTASVLSFVRAVSESVDLDGDGIDELIGDYGVAFWRNGQWFGAPLFTQLSKNFSGVPMLVEPVHDAFDVDGDGDLDIVSGGGRWGSLWRGRIQLNDGEGQFRPMIDSGIDPDAERLRAFDIDGDGRPDLMGAEALLQNVAGTRFVDRAPGWPPIGIWSNSDWAAADLDGDGDGDLVYANGGTTTNPGAGVLVAMQVAPWTFAAPAAQPGARNPSLLQLVDFDADGDLDILASGHGVSADHVVLLANDGMGTFVDATSTLPAPNSRRHARWFVDVDGDGDLDHFRSAPGTTNGKQLFLHDAGQWVDVSATHLPQDGVPAERPPHFVDLDGDGDVDWVGERIYFNDGAGRFAPDPNRSALDTTGMWPFDADLDGDMDLMGVGLLRNREVQLSRRGLCRSGGSLELELAVQSGYGTAARWGVVAFAPAGGLPVQTGVGTLLLDPARAGVLGVVPVAAATGLGFLSMPVPRSPMLVGTEFWVQGIAFSGAAARLTNRLRVAVDV